VSGAPAPAGSGFADVGGGRLYYEARGTGRPLVLVHGGLLGRRLWDAVLAPFSRRYRVFRFDQRGYGDSDRPSGVYSYWEDLRRLADHWALPRAVYVGFGEGGAAAIDLALAAPERVEALVLISSYLHGYDYAPAFQTGLQKLADAYLTDGASAVADRLLKDDRYPPPADRADARKRLRELIIENAHVLAFNWMHVRPLDPLAAGQLGEMKAPTLVMTGDRDAVDNRNVADRLRFGIPGAREVLVPGGHVLPLEAPAAIVENVVQFLDGIKS
jgi:pimeloyl-ACP methyl ester carboxylesterase